MYILSLCKSLMVPLPSHVVVMFVFDMYVCNFVLYCGTSGNLSQGVSSKILDFSVFLRPLNYNNRAFWNSLFSYLLLCCHNGRMALFV